MLPLGCRGCQLSKCHWSLATMCSYESNVFYFLFFFTSNNTTGGTHLARDKKERKEKRLNIVEITKRESRSLNVVWM
jgi:hypothetical protein